MAKLCRMPGSFIEDYNKVACIKAFRHITGLDLKDSKDAVELAASGGAFVLRDKIVLRDCDDQIAILKANGLLITGSADKVQFILRSMRANAKMAIDCEENNLAILILDMLERFDDDRKK